MTPRARTREEFEEHFWGLVDRRAPSECWDWKGRPMGLNPTTHPRGDYGAARLMVGANAINGAHRVACYLVHGAPPAWGRDWHAAHSCDRPPCCNPGHLAWTHRTENMRDAWVRLGTPIGNWFSREWRADAVAAYALAHEYLTDPARRTRVLWKIAREEAEKVLRPLVLAEIERLAPTFATEYAQSALAGLKSGHFVSDYNARQAAERCVVRAIERLEFTVTLPEPAAKGGRR